MGGGDKQISTRRQAEALFVRGPSSPTEAAGSRKPEKFYQGEIVLQTAQAIEAFVAVAQPRNEFVFCEAPEEMRSADCWVRAGQLERSGLVRLHRRRRAGGGWQFYAVRTKRPLPRQVSLAEKALSDRAAAIIFAQLKREANLDLPASSNAELARLAGLSLRESAGQKVAKLIAAGLIQSEQVYERGVAARVVTILATPHAGSAAGKATRLPEKWRALRSAAERELRAADDADLKRLREAGL